MSVELIASIIGLLLTALGIYLQYNKIKLSISGRQENGYFLFYYRIKNIGKVPTTISNIQREISIDDTINEPYQICVFNEENTTLSGNLFDLPPGHYIEIMFALNKSVSYPPSNFKYCFYTSDNKKYYFPQI